MAKIRRNGPCPCGSGSKAKRCCYGVDETVDGLLPQEIGDDAIADLNGTDEVELRTYFDQLLYLPEIDTSLQVRLPGIITPDMDRAINALRDDDDEEFDEALDKVVVRYRFGRSAPRTSSSSPQASRPGSDQTEVRRHRRPRARPR